MKSDMQPLKGDVRRLQLKIYEQENGCPRFDWTMKDGNSEVVKMTVDVYKAVQKVIKKWEPKFTEKLNQEEGR